MSKTASAPLISLLNSGRMFYMADLYTFTLSTGTVLRYTGHDRNVTFSNNVFTSMPTKRGAIKEAVDINVDTLEVDMYPPATELVMGLPFLQAVAVGIFDGCQLQVERAFFADQPNFFMGFPVGALIRFVGNMASMVLDRGSVAFTINSFIELLNIQLPRNVYQPGCLHTLYDTGCAILKSNFSTTSVVTSGSTKTLINCGLSQAARYFDLGTIDFTAGPNVNTSRTVKSYTPGVVQLTFPLNFVPVNGDSFTAHPGCDKTSNMCTVKFNNLINFRGYEYIPVAETAL
jgi:uncharacterized phage protein (TIGR02218 family)